MTGILIAAIVLAVLALALLYRIFRGPTAADRIAALDALDLLAALTMALYSLYTGRGIFLDIALVTAILGFIGSTIIGKYLEGKL